MIEANYILHRGSHRLISINMKKDGLWRTVYKANNYELNFAHIGQSIDFTIFIDKNNKL